MNDREEMLAALVAEYRAELAQLSDVELLTHFKQMKGVERLTDADWAKIRAGWVDAKV